MSNELIQDDKFFLSRFGMTESALERSMGAALERKADYADLYFEYRSAEGLSLEDSIVNRTSKSVSDGVGVGVGGEEGTGYAYSDEVTADRMRLAAEAARAIAHSGGDAHAAVQVGRPVARHELYELESTPLEVPLEERARLLNEIDRVARQFDPRGKTVMAAFAPPRTPRMVGNSEARIPARLPPLC